MVLQSSSTFGKIVPVACSTCFACCRRLVTSAVEISVICLCIVMAKIMTQLLRYRP